MSLKTVLVTGGAGFIGGHLVERLLEKYHVVVMDNLSTGKISNLPQHSQLDFVFGDIRKKEDVTCVFETYTFTYVYHLAAVASVAASIEKPLETHQTNVDGTIHLLNAAKKQTNTIQKFVFASSAAVYGSEPTLPKSETSVIAPITPYGIDKLASESYVISYSHLFGLNTSAARFFNVYGPRQNPDSPYSGVLSILTQSMQRVLAGDETSPFTLYGDGSQVRDFVYVDDIVNGLILLAESVASQSEVFNIASDENHTLLEVIAMYEGIVGKKLPLIYQHERAGDIHKSYADISKIKAIGYRATNTLKMGLAKYHQYEMTKVMPVNVS
ncbi:NAD-dependent epimerase/dehydratase family protein [Listeria booriae]|uniref:NAD-dependent epimerase/dehydratase family protein n=1 Tax=Listeria booriae TaxID=1552123 RepID=A0A7X1DA41_9LIST|nr:NAD-dependent epimerase/dehydratase family protein [Listeria booriae]MBC1227107.1 NAD-dependent epimerase/dehydratase family protein [Listeria booriae]MBC1333323.1 NAD-dependent epimerase/dehydratase family protein [Listeria booriae]MBC2178345.1 NAD-dependent epimerase/dehydratase family protein [Listeria booriae]MBC2388723.1 NAD-dependent epimerase/dehydratase family protein [Listeria booriae]